MSDTIHRMIARLMLGVWMLFGPTTTGSDDAPYKSLPSYESRYYIIYSDLEPEQVQEAKIHITRVAEVYASRTKDFSGVIREKLPFVLFRRHEDYVSAGGHPESDGVFDGEKLMAVAGEKLNARTWHVVQHEGFHQFARAVIGGEIPAWVNEGLAEYFGEGIYTGDDFFTGVIPEWRRKRIVNSIKSHRFKTVSQMMQVSYQKWNSDINAANYDQAWAMIQFLAHGENGKYQPPFNNFMRALSRGTSAKDAWRASFGDDAGFEERFEEYWLKLPDNPTDDIYRRATVATLTSFLARAYAAGQDFDAMPDFAKAASDDSLKCAAEDVLPRSLLSAAMTDVAERLKAGEVFSLEHAKGKHPKPRIVVRREGATPITGEFVLRDGHVERVTIDQRRGR